MKFIFLLIIVLATVGCGSFRTGDEKLVAQLPESRIHYFTDGTHPIRYLRIGNRQGPLLLFIHGAPGSLDMFKDFFHDEQLTDRFDVISIDRPGYGYSRYGDAEPGIHEQAVIIIELLNALNKNEIYLAGHSYGASIAAAIAGLENNRIDGLILMAGTMSPPDEVMFWFNGLAEYPPVKWLLSGALDVANIEKMAHARELEKNLSLFGDFKGKVLVLHAEKDFLAPFEGNVAMMERLYASRMTLIPFKKGNHLFILRQGDQVIQAILDFTSEKKLSARGSKK